MQPVSAFVIFIMIWWSVIFCVLPIGLSTTYEKLEEGEDYRLPGAPRNLNIKKKMMITTAISIILWVVIFIIIQSGIIDFKNMSA